MFYGLRYDDRQRVVVLNGPAQDFEQCVIATPQIVLEWSMVHGWLAIWEAIDERYELIAETPGVEMLRRRSRKAVVSDDDD